MSQNAIPIESGFSSESRIFRKGNISSKWNHFLIPIGVCDMPDYNK